MQFFLWVFLRWCLVVISTVLLCLVLEFSLGESLVASLGAYSLYCLFRFEHEMRVYFSTRTRAWVAWMLGFGWGPGMAAAVFAFSSICMFETLTEKYAPNEQIQNGIMLCGALLSLYLCYRALKLISRSR